MNVLIPSVYEVYLCDPTGVRIDLLDNLTEFEYAKIVNDRSAFRIRLPASFDRSLLKLDNLIDIYRGYTPGSLYRDYCGFVRGWMFADDNGSDFTELYGWSLLDLARRRVVADYAGGAEAKLTDYADDMIKAIGKDQLGSDAIAGRDLTSVGGGFTIQSDASGGVSITKAFSYKNVLQEWQEIANASKQAGTAVYFDIVATGALLDKLAFDLRTYTGERGDDRTEDSDAPVYVGPAWGNMQNAYISYDYGDEINDVYVLGVGAGESRENTEVSSTTRQGASIWNRCEGVRDARHLEQGSADQRTAEGNAMLEEGKPRFRFGGDIVETETFRYGRDWFWGDRVSFSYADVQKDALISVVNIQYHADGSETITARLEGEE